MMADLGGTKADAGFYLSEPTSTASQTKTARCANLISTRNFRAQGA